MKIAALLATTASLAYSDIIKGSHVFDFGVQLDWETDTAAETFTMTSTQPNNSYFVVFLGKESKVNTDCIMFLATGATSKAVDCYSSSNSDAPTPDVKNDVTSELLSKEWVAVLEEK